MTPEYKNILFPTDLSNESRAAFDHAISLANRYGARITVLHVLEEMSRASSNLLTTYLGREKLQEIANTQKQDTRKALIGKKKEALMIKDALTAFCDAAQKDHPECTLIMDDIEVVIAEGHVVDEIVTEGGERHCDLIVMGYHARGKIEGAVLGSTSQRLLRKSGIPVFLIRMNA
ncbi:MAG: universal stress protein [Deltaproteobacteria bacterium]|nr:universal stress protein [Deltaproteobacteria bacterium]